MNEDELRRLRERITHDQTSCRCGHLLAACADCRDWLGENSLRIAAGLRWWHNQTINLGAYVAGQRAADAAEADDRAYFGL